VSKQPLLEPTVFELSKPLESKVPSMCPAFIPYNVQHLILTTTQRLLEECCFDFALRWAPTLLADKGWDYPEMVELTVWAKTLAKLYDKLPAEAIFNDSGATLRMIFSSIDPLRHSAVHQLRTSAQAIQKMVQFAVRLAVTLGDSIRAASLELVEKDLDRRIKDTN
jgi:hypothetical protein